MFDLFGEFDSMEELNQSAEGLREEGDLVNLQKLAEENGIPAEIAQMYGEGDLDLLCEDAATAALGKLTVEAAGMKLEGILSDWRAYIEGQCLEDEAFARQVRKKGKSMEGCLAALLMWSFKHQMPVDRKILTAAKVTAAKVTLGIPGMGQARQIIREYYMGGTR